MSRRIAAAAVLACLVAAAATVPAPAWAQNDEKHVIKIESEVDGGGWLGIGITELDEKTRQKSGIGESVKGILITEIYEDSPAEEAGLRENDVVVSIDGETGEDLKTFVDLVRSKEPGTKVEIRVHRDGEMKTLHATLAEREYTYEWHGLESLEALKALEGLKALEHIYIPEISIGLAGAGSRGRLGVYVDELTEGLAEYFDAPDGKGVLVEGVVEDSPAEKAGIKAGDIIYRIDGERIWDTDDLVDAISDMETGKETPIVLIRKGREMTVQAVVEESATEKAMKAYEKALQIKLGDNGDPIVIRGLDMDELDEETKAELRAELEELRRELQELKKEIEEERKELEEELRRGSD
jgi:S1-C subfamily serine protease